MGSRLTKIGLLAGVGGLTESSFYLIASARLSLYSYSTHCYRRRYATQGQDVKQHKYQIGVMGKLWFDRALFDDELERQFGDLGISKDEYLVLEEVELDRRDNRAPFVAVFFGYDAASSANHSGITEIIEDSLPIIPCVVTLDGYRGQVPNQLSNFNGLALNKGALIEIHRLISCIFENLALLRTDRRIFISYRRADSREIALQLYDAFQARGFDTFLDTHSIQPAVDMQDHLWHRLADSDVVVLLDSPDFSTSEWTLMEKARANATSVQILHLLWPEVEEDPYSALSEFFKLRGSDFRAAGMVGPDARFQDNTLHTICLRVESLRAHALALRHAYLVDQFCDFCRDRSLVPILHPQRFITIENDGEAMFFVPAIGVPNAFRINQIEQAISRSHSSNACVTVLYDNRGLLNNWVSHMAWLNSHLKVKTLAASDFRNHFGEVAQ